MKPYELHLGDCLEVLRTLPDNSVDSIVTDPPYGLTSNSGGPSDKGRDGPHGRAKAGASRGGFMGLKWDSSVPPVEVWAECLRVLKPGGHLLAFAGTRTQHRMAVRIEDAGFEIRDMIAWVYGSGFPKSHNGEWGGTALKPALEPITMARKPLTGTVEANWRKHGTGALNIDGCRVSGQAQPFGNPTAADGWRMHKREADWQPNTAGRWPANLIHDGSAEVIAAFPNAPGQLGPISTTAPSPKTSNVYGAMRRSGEESADRRYAVDGRDFSMLPGARRGDTGSAARFFYAAKASRADRNEGVGGSDQPAVEHGARMRDREDADWPARNGNSHPTVKPTDLMAYLCRLVTPPGGLVLDLFMGSGSTGKAAMREGFRFIGIELDAGYLAIAEARISFELAKRTTEAAATPAQSDMFSDLLATAGR